MMMPIDAETQALIDNAYSQGQEAGRMEARVSSLEKDRTETAKILKSIGELLTANTTAIQLVALESKNRDDENKRMWEQRDRETALAAKAVKDVLDNTASAAKNEREEKAEALLTKTNKETLKWTPRNGWTGFISVGVAGIAVVVAVFFGAYAMAKDSTTKTSCVVIVTGSGCTTK